MNVKSELNYKNFLKMFKKVDVKLQLLKRRKMIGKYHITGLKSQIRGGEP